MAKNRKQKLEEYSNKYNDIPRDDTERMDMLFTPLTVKKKNTIYDTMARMDEELKFNEVTFVLYEEPEGSPRPRFRIINRQQLLNAAISNSNFVHVYSPVASSDNAYMKRLTDSEIIELQSLIYTPCVMVIDAYLKTPSVFNQTDTVLAEKKYIRPISKPDWDNIGKKYSDMCNNNIWYDDAFVVTGMVNKYYSVLPRLEIKIAYLNKLYNRYQYNQVKNKLGPGQTVDYFTMEG